MFRKPPARLRYSGARSHHERKGGWRRLHTTEPECPEPNPASEIKETGIFSNLGRNLLLICVIELAVPDSQGYCQD
jgi:hypothetical protein